MELLLSTPGAPLARAASPYYFRWILTVLLVSLALHPSRAEAQVKTVVQKGIRQVYEASAPGKTGTPFEPVEEGMREETTMERLVTAGQLEAAIVLGDSVILRGERNGTRRSQFEWIAWVAVQHQRLGQMEASDTLYVRSIALHQTRGDSLEAAEVASWRAAVFATRQPARSDSLFRIAADMYRAAAGPMSPQYVTALVTASELVRWHGDVARADSLYREAALLARRVPRSESSYFLGMNYTLALYAESQSSADSIIAQSGLPAEARGDILYLRAVNARARGENARADSLVSLLGESRLESVMDLYDKAVRLEMQGRVKDGLRVLARAVEPMDRERDDDFARSSLDALDGVPSGWEYLTFATVTLNARHVDEPEVASLGLTLLLRYKGSEQDAAADLWAWYRHDPAEAVLLDSMAKVRTTISALTSRAAGMSLLDTLQRRAAVARAQAEYVALEGMLGRTSRRRAPRQPRVTLPQVQAAIPADAALVELVWYDPVRRSLSEPAGPGAPRYGAYVLTRQGPPRFVDLAAASTLDSLVVRFRVALAARNGAASAELARRLGDAVLRPLRPHLGASPHVLISPDGLLNLLPFAALKGEDGRYFIEGHTITYLTSGRDLLRLQERPPVVRRRPLVVANPDYARPVRRRAGGARPSAAGATQRGRFVADLGSMWWEPLPGTAQEAAALMEILPSGQFVQDTGATESLLKRTVRPSILHVATHGFFLGDTIPGAASAGSRPSATLSLARAGLVLAGANRREGGDGEDGILTALEVSGLDLAGTELVVLSACETGVGRASNGQGVYGMRRALVVAGARAQLTTLWRVDDVTTRDMMKEYYERLRRGEGRSAALRNVQLGMLSSSGRADPGFWAAFVPLGDWTPLPVGTLTGGTTPGVAPR